MAAELAVDLTKSGLEKSISGAFKEVRFALGIKSHIKKLEKTMVIFENHLADADAAPSTSTARHLTLEQVSDLVEKFRDFLDERAARAMQREITMSESGSITKVLRFFSLSSNPIGCALKDARKVKAFIEEIDHVANLLRMPFFTVSQTETEGEDTGPLTSELVIGRDGDRDNIVRMLLEPSSSQDTSVYSIVGIGGIGKSTLARYVLDDQRVKDYFDITFWVYVPQTLVAKDVLKNMVAYATKDNRFLNERVQMAQLQYLLHPIIFGKKYLLVLDNIWDRKDLGVNWPKLWQQLGGHAGAGSMVLTTTRSAKAAKTIGSVDTYMLSELATDDSLRLFQKFAFTQRQEPGVEAIGKEIVEKCPKVPLVIESIGRHLGGKDSIVEWEDFKDKHANLSYYGQIEGVMQ